ncbi:class III lanthionine synthetase LanKC [Spongiactinospora sp. 9N601]|uniref:class III lanthionine synthetase LanKC n=1 Tax=Spongiactinospora sp. 9N601 TaxID=3375149 RepID=UPI0037AABACE
MDRRYELYCKIDPHFYDRAERVGSDIFPVLRDELMPAGWRCSIRPGWIHYHPPGVRLPRQGWKIHVSASKANVERVLLRVLRYCFSRGIALKAVPGPVEWRNRNDKYADRAGSGKLVTIYPSDEEQFAVVLEGLGSLLTGEEGPYILSDVRWGDGPLYVRYGAFQDRRTHDGALAIEDPSGNLVPDPRGPVFAPPEWAPVPAILKPAIQLRDRTRLDAFPYDIERALHFSNGGGVYYGRVRGTGREVVVKEGRRHAGVDKAGRDAVDRLRREHDILQRLDGLPAVPGLIDYVAVDPHEFLVEEFVVGETLWAACTRRNPLIRAGEPEPHELAEYARWAKGTWRRVADAVHAMHERGVVFGDLHLFNVFVRDEEIRIIDFEGGWFLEEGGRQVIANPGFAAPAGTVGVAVDEYALANLKLALFAPLTSLALVDKDKPRHLAGIISRTFGVECSWFSGGDAARSSPADPIESLTQAIMASATLDRVDRLFPGDINQFLAPGGGVGFAHGAAGVLWALRQARREPFPEGERWLMDRVRAEGESLTSGFYDGRHGIAYALWDLGRHDEAIGLVRSLAREFDEHMPDHGLLAGLSGVGLNWLHFGRECGEDAFTDLGIRAAESVIRLLGGVDSAPEISGGEHGQAGLMHGSSGKALLLTAAYEATGDLRFLDAAEVALRQDLRRCVVMDDGGLQVNEGSRGMPYLAGGSVGIGLAIQRYLSYRQAPDLRSQLERIGRAASSSFYLFPGLFNGMAGQILLNATLGDTAAVARQVRGLDWHAVTWRDHMAFPGDQLLRLSMDLATGNGGVLLALTAAKGEFEAGLPFLTPGFSGAQFEEKRTGDVRKEVDTDVDFRPSGLGRG